MNIGKSTYVGAANHFQPTNNYSKNPSSPILSYNSPSSSHKSYKLPSYHHSPRSASVASSSPRFSETSSNMSRHSQKHAQAYTAPDEEETSWTMFNFWPEPSVIWLFGALLLIVTCTNFYWLSVCHDIPSNNETEMTLDVALQQLAYHDKTRESEHVIEVLR